MMVYHLTDVIEAEGFTSGWDDERETAIADLDAIRAWASDLSDDALIESHLAHRMPVDLAIVLRCAPEQLRRRLEDRYEEGTATASIEENVESERLDVILVEAVEGLGPEHVVEIDTTERSVAEAADAVAAAIAGELLTVADRTNGDVSQ